MCECEKLFPVPSNFFNGGIGKTAKHELDVCYFFLSR